jgi:hypothetical protein
MTTPATEMGIEPLVERVAQAIWHTQWEEPWPREGGIEHAQALEIARAAIAAFEAARTPELDDTEMCDACNGSGFGVADTYCGKCGGAGGYPATRTPEAAQWQPIETAPQGCMCLFADMTATEARDWAFVDWIVGAQFCGDRRRTATHWMPLPAPPALAQVRHPSGEQS